MNKGTPKQFAVKILCLLSSVLLLIVGIIHVADGAEARLHWPKKDQKFSEDWVNRISWRMSLFSFAPHVFIDAWTPIVLGLIGIGSHIKGCPDLIALVASDMLTTSIFQLVCGLFGTIAYAGGIGIIFSVVTFLASLAAMVVFFMEDGPAGLDLVIKASAK